MDFLDVSIQNIGGFENVKEVTLDELKAAEASINNEQPYSELFDTFVGDYTIYAKINDDSTIDSTCIVADADGIVLAKNGRSLQTYYKNSTNDDFFADFAARAAEFAITRIPNPTPGAPYDYHIRTCEASRIHVNPSTGSFMTEDEATAVTDRILARKISLGLTMTEVIYTKLKARQPDADFRVWGCHYKIDRHDFVRRPHSDYGFPRDAFTDDVIHSKAYHSGVFEFGDPRVKLQVDRILRNVVLDESGRPVLRVNLTALSAIMNYHLLISRMPELELVTVTNETNERVQPGFIYILKTSKMAVCEKSDRHLVVCVPGLPSDIKEFVGELLFPPSTDHSGDVSVKITGEYSFRAAFEEALCAELEHATMEKAILFAKQGDLPRAMVELAVVAVRREKSRFASYMLERSLDEIPEALDEQMEEAYDGGSPDSGHLALHRDCIHGLRHRGRVRRIAVKPRGVRDIGVTFSDEVRIPHKTTRGYKMTVVVRQSQTDMRRRVHARLRSPLSAAVEVIKTVTGVSVLGVAFTRTGSGKTYELEQDAAAYSLLQGNFGTEGFNWMCGAILSNKVEVDPHSEALGYFPNGKIRFADGGLLVNEPLQGSVEMLNCITNQRVVLVDWGPILGAVKVTKGEEGILEGREVERLVDRRTWFRCALSARYMFK